MHDGKSTNEEVKSGDHNARGARKPKPTPMSEMSGSLAMEEGRTDGASDNMFNPVSGLRPGNYSSEEDGEMN